MSIKTDCYLAKLRIYKHIYPKAHFEVITRSANSILSPSWELLKKAKSENWSFQEYKTKLLEELSSNPKVKSKLEELKKVSEEKLLFLVCYEKILEEFANTLLFQIVFYHS